MACPSPDRLSDSVFSLFEPEEPDAEFVFFHGAVHEASHDMHIRAWMSSGVCWPAAWLQDEPDFPRARILSIQYDSSLKRANDAGVYSMRLLAEALANDLILISDVGQRGRPVVLVGHDLGGLVIKELCVYLQNQISLQGSRRYERFLENVRGIFYFSTPHHGSDFGGDKIYLDGELVPSLTVFDSETAQLNEDFEKLRRSRTWMTAGLGPLLVDPKSSLRVCEASVRPGSDNFMMVKESMESINKPNSKLSSSYRTFVDRVKDFVQAELKQDSDFDFKEFMRSTVGLESAVEELHSIFREAKGRTRGLVLHGMGGIGKSTLGEALFLKLSRNFDRDCRCQVDREAISKPQLEGKITELQQSILDCLGHRSSSCHQKWTAMLRKCYEAHSRPLLFFIDNIEHQEELEDIFPKPIDDILPHGSYIIVATRNLRMLSTLRELGLREVSRYDVKELDESSAEKLFSECAFGHTYTEHLYVQSQKDAWKGVLKILDVCSGLPLALKVVGAALSPHERDSRSSPWTVDLILERLRNWFSVEGRTNSKDILQKSLEFSYSELDEDTKQAFLDIVFCFQGSPWHELQILYGDRLDILKRRALIKRESRTESGCSFPTVKVHALLVSLGERKGRDLGSHIKLDVQEDGGIEDIHFSPEEGRGVVLVFRGTMPSFPSLDMKTVFHRLASRAETPALPVQKLQCLARSLRILILRDLRIGGTFVTEDLPMNLQCFICVNGSVPFLRGDMTNLKKLMHVDIATAIDEHDSYTFPGGLKKLRLETPHLKVFKFESAGQELGLRELGLMSIPSLHHQVQNQIIEFQSLRKLVIRGITGLNNNLPPGMFQMRSLESLSVQYCEHISVIPDFRNMKNLQHFQLALPDLKTLPDSLLNLRNLRSLQLESCFSLEQLPPGFGNMHSNPKLEWISVRTCCNLKALPCNFEAPQPTTKLPMQELQVLNNLGSFEGYFFRKGRVNFELIEEAAAATQMPPLIEQFQMFQVRRLSPSVYELLPESSPDVEIIFFHGLPEEASDPKQAWWRTWRRGSSEECWPMTVLPEVLTKEDGTRYKARILSVSYECVKDSENGNFSRDDNLSAAALSLIQELIIGKGNVGQKDGVPVVLVGHDLGCFLIKHLMLTMWYMIGRRLGEPDDSEASAKSSERKIAEFLKNVASHFFYAMPYGGSKITEGIATEVLSDTDDQKLRFMKELDCNQRRINDNVHSFRCWSGQLVRVAVQPQRERHGSHCDKQGLDCDWIYSVNADRLTVCKPYAADDIRLKLLSNHIIIMLEMCTRDRKWLNEKDWRENYLEMALKLDGSSRQRMSLQEERADMYTRAHNESVRVLEDLDPNDSMGSSFATRMIITALPQVALWSDHILMLQIMLQMCRRYRNWIHRRNWNEDYLDSSFTTREQSLPEVVASTDDIDQRDGNMFSSVDRQKLAREAAKQNRYPKDHRITSWAVEFDHIPGRIQPGLVLNVTLDDSQASLCNQILGFVHYAEAEDEERLSITFLHHVLRKLFCVTLPMSTFCPGLFSDADGNGLLGYKLSDNISASNYAIAIMGILYKVK